MTNSRRSIINANFREAYAINPNFFIEVIIIESSSSLKDGPLCQSHACKPYPIINATLTSSYKCSSFFTTSHISKFSNYSALLRRTFPLLAKITISHSQSKQPFLSPVLIWNPEMKIWFCGLQNLSFRCIECVSSWLSTELSCFETGLLISAVKRTAMSLLTCILALGKFLGNIFILQLVLPSNLNFFFLASVSFLSTFCAIKFSELIQSPLTLSF